MSVGLGLGITLGVIAVAAICIIIIGICTSKRRLIDFQGERQRRIDRLRQQHQREQAQWRERRLRDVVLLLIDRGEAEEGVPLAFQLPNKPEVSARRALRSRRGYSQSRQQIEMELATQEENSRLDPESLAIALKPLEELLASGRPTEAEAGPDVMQLLLDGQEVREHSSDEDEDEDDFITMEDCESASRGMTPTAGSMRSGQPPGLSETSQQTTPPLSGRAYNTQQPPVQLSPSREATLSPPSSGNHVSGREIDVEALTAQSLQEDQRRRDAREAALLHELQRERRRRRRKTAEEVYGEPVPYEPNPGNDIFAEVPPLIIDEEAPQSPLWKFLSPLTPFRSRRSTRAGSAMPSAFEGQSPNQSSMFIPSTKPTAAPSPNRKSRMSGSPY